MASFSLSKTQKYKLFLERRGYVFPVEVDLGHYNDRNNVFRSRMAFRDAERALKKKELDVAMIECKNTMFLLTLERVEDPLVELDNVHKLVVTVVQVRLLTFKLNLLKYQEILSPDRVPPRLHGEQEDGHGLVRRRDRLRLKIGPIRSGLDQDLQRIPKDQPEEDLMLQDGSHVRELRRWARVQEAPAGEDLPGPI